MAALAVVGSASAHEGPATDVLERANVFLPLGGKVPTANAHRLEETVRRAGRAGYPIKVAAIAEPADLGEVYQFWGRPQSYARFLGSLLRLDYKGELLIVMPAGFGLARDGRDADRTALNELRVAHSARGLADSATAAVVALATSSGHSISAPVPAPPTATATNENRVRDRLVIAGTAALLVALTFAFPVFKRRRARTAR